MICPYCKSNQLIKKGFSNPIASLGGKRRQRFKCLTCGRKSSINSHSINFRLKKRDQALNSKIFFFFVRGLSNRQIGLALDLSEQCVRNRLARLARRAMIFHERKLQGKLVSESIAYDGVENFAISQYDPNNINHAIGAESLFIYDFNFAPLNRKGRISEWQRRRLVEIEDQEGRYDPSAVRRASKEIIGRLCRERRLFELLTDEHFHYRKVVNDDLADENIYHKTISSKACRNFQNILFSVNHTDLMLRQRIACFARETISFSKTPGSMCQKYVLFMVSKNYMLPQFTKKHVRRPEAHKKSPAQLAGVSNTLLKFGDIFNEFPRQDMQQELNSDWKYFWDGEVPPQFRRNKKYLRSKG